MVMMFYSENFHLVEELTIFDEWEQAGGGLSWAQDQFPRTEGDLSS